MPAVGVPNRRRPGEAALNLGAPRPDRKSYARLRSTAPTGI